MARRSLAKAFGVTNEGGCLPGRLLAKTFGVLQLSVFAWGGLAAPAITKQVTHLSIL